MGDPHPQVPIDWQSLGQESLKHFKALLRIDTTNPPGNEIEAAKYIAALLDQEGIEYQMLESEPGRASLVARLRGSGKAGPLLLNGHLDVVPVDPEAWDHPPFDAVEAEGCIWGRGAIDMKNMVTMGLMTLITLHRRKVPLDRDVIFAAVADEEAGSDKGAVFLVENHPELVRAEYVLNEVGGHTLYMGDTRFYPIQVSEKGICWFRLKAIGEPGHGSMPHPGNPVLRIARAIEKLGSTRLPQHNTEVVEGFLKALAGGAPFPRNKVMALLLHPAFSNKLLDVLDRVQADQAMGINAMLRHTAAPTMLSGSKKVNVIPGSASVTVDGRVLPGYSTDDFLREVQAVVGDDLELEVLNQHEGTRFDSNTPLYDAICNSLKRHDSAAVPVPYMIPGFTDSFAYARLGATCYGFSPVKLGPELNFTRMYHGHNERIPVDGYLWGQRVLYELVEGFCKVS
ncbi:MAG: M20/M25/M40 family metallo-hydrolase [Polyangiaceae bacterium]|nr:M20/M25/M40 family metallo-hydrolase [Myxococcales bacterium]MCB9583860.1 M20/M25/M40 family metallo-hydrolase [Polyangiaceae bacterium]MCB9607884.1 M20/M25/M40 family metallo-hydrolase [Polyangiaceae bacterium]